MKLVGWYVCFYVDLVDIVMWCMVCEFLFGECFGCVEVYLVGVFEIIGFLLLW